MVKNKSTKKSTSKKTSTSKKSTRKKSSKKNITSKKTVVKSKTVKEESPLHYERRWCAALSYLLVGLIWYFFDDNMKKDPFVKYHVKQGLVLLMSLITLQVLLSLMIFLTVVWLLMGLFLLIIGLIGVVYALEYKKKPMPVIGKYAKNFTF